MKHFSVVNQRFGRDRGTKIMVDYIGRLETLLGDTELVCRVGGDNFIVLFLKEKLESVIRHMEGVEIATEDAGECAFVSAIAGYYMVNQPVKYPSDLMDRANVALNVAKYSKTTDRIFTVKPFLNCQMSASALKQCFRMPCAMRNLRSITSQRYL